MDSKNWSDFRAALEQASDAEVLTLLEGVEVIVAEDPFSATICSYAYLELTMRHHMIQHKKGL